MMSREPLTLASATASHLLQMMSWFPSAESCRIWGGPEFRFPFTAATFQADCQLTERHSFALLEAGAVFCGFGHTTCGPGAVTSRASPSRPRAAVAGSVHD